MAAKQDSNCDFAGLSRDQLVQLVYERDKRIQDLERLVEDQKRLRLQDSNQVEEKAAKIKEWVTNKLKELENQNKLLRDQNKKQKQAIDSLTIKLVSMSPISSPRKQILQPNFDQVQYIDQSTPTPQSDTTNSNQSFNIRRPQLKHKIQLSHPNNKIYVNSQLEDGQGKSCTRPDNSSLMRCSSNDRMTNDKGSFRSSSTMTRNTGVSLISIGPNSAYNSLRAPPKHYSKTHGKESPLYDTVNIDPSILADSASRNDHDNSSNEIERLDTGRETTPPPLPPHQSDKWERQLYDLAERTFSSLTNELEATCQAVSDRQQNGFDDPQINDRKSSYLKDSIRSFVKPSFTTIDGDQVVDDEDQPTDGHRISSNDNQSLDISAQNTNDRHSSSTSNGQRSGDYSTGRGRQSSDDHVSHIFSPIRTRAGKDSILRTQSVKKNPAPEKLFDFLSADLIKRGYLLKYGALRNHQRWFVLKNFHLSSYKREIDETEKLEPLTTLKLEPQFQVQASGRTNDGYAFKITCHDKQSLTLIADTSQDRDNWIRILSVTISMSDIQPDSLTKQNFLQEGILTVTKQGHSKKCYAILTNYLVFFLKSHIDPTPLSYLSIKEAKIREVTDNLDYDLTQSEPRDGPDLNQLQDHSIAIYPKFSLNLDPIYITLGGQQETDDWFYQLSVASEIDQANGTMFERVLTQLMLNSTVTKKRQFLSRRVSDSSTDSGTGCLWRDNLVMLYSDKPLAQPLTSLPNETLKAEALELSKSILLFTQVPIEPVAIDYHVCLLQNCFARFIRYPELKNEFYALLIKQSTYVRHQCFGSKLSSSSSSSGCSSINQRSSLGSISPSAGDCQLITDLRLLDSISHDRDLKYETRSTISQGQTNRDRLDHSPQPGEANPPSRGEILQVMQIIALAVSINLPRGRVRWWLIHHLRKFANADTEIGKYALFALKAIDRTVANGSRENVPSRTEIMSILLRNPYDHSTAHSLPVNFEDNSYMIVGADGSTTVEEFMTSIGRKFNIRPSALSDFYLFADDPNDAKDTLHILEPQRKILDVVGWWEQVFKQQNSGRYQNTRVIKLHCRKRLVLRAEEGETEQERLLIIHQLNREVAAGMPLAEELLLELAAIMSQLIFGDLSKSMSDGGAIRRALDTIESKFLPLSKSAQSRQALAQQVLCRWQKLSGRTTQDCIRVYLNCTRRLKL